MDWTRAAGLVAVIFVACGDSGDSTSSSTTDDAVTTSTTTAVGTSGDIPTTGAGTTADTGVGEWDECTQISLAPPEVMQTAAVGIIPQPIGGEIADGVYVLTSYEVFGAAGLTSDLESGVFVFGGPGYQLGTLNSAANGTFSTMGSDITFTAECACSRVFGSCDMTVQTPGTRSYTYFDGFLLIFSDYINGGTALATYTKQ